MRIAVMGDLQYSAADKDALKAAVRDINALSPNAVVILGDYGQGRDLGTGKGMFEVADIFKDLKAETVVYMLGNHDLQLETGDNVLPHGATARVYRQAFGVSACNRVLDFEDFSIVTVNVDPQPKGEIQSVNECYVSDENFEELKNVLKERKGAPVILFTHAPPLGAGLITVPEVHVRATNAFLDQNYDPKRWLGLIQEFPGIAAWFSGHYHLGHDYPKSMSRLGETAFFITGVCTSYSRDKTRQSRIVDVGKDGIKVTTYDHLTHALRAKSDWPAERKNEDGGFAFETGSGNAVKMRLGKNGRLYSQTDNGFLWEIDLSCGEAMGTLHYSKTQVLNDFFPAEDGIVKLCGNGAFLHRYSDRRRFMRENGQCQSFEVDAPEVKKGAEDGLYIRGGKILDGAGRAVYQSKNGRITAFCFLKNKEGGTALCVALDSAGRTHTRYERAESFTG